MLPLSLLSVLKVVTFRFSTEENRMPHIPRHNSFHTHWELADINPCVMPFTFSRFCLVSRETQFKNPKLGNSCVQPCSTAIHGGKSQIAAPGFRRLPTPRGAWNVQKELGKPQALRVLFLSNGVISNFTSVCCGTEPQQKTPPN